MQQAASDKETKQERFVTLFIGGKEYKYTGNWQWELQCECVFCSDVMLSFPQRFEGAKGIIHPDDKGIVLERTKVANAAEVSFFQFRIITTYGEVKTLTGRNLQAVDVVVSYNPVADQQEQLNAETVIHKQAQKLSWQKRAGELAERLTATGIWYLDSETHEMYYSDEVFRIYGLPRQSLNAHLNTFASFIHPKDRDIVGEAFTKSLKERLSLYIDYRIITQSGEEKMLRQATHWEYNEKGQHMLYGMLQDISEQTALERNIQLAENDLHFGQKVLQLQEQAAAIGHWTVNLLTRKVFYSDNMYRLHGIRAGAIAPGSNIFFNYVHPEDRDLVQDVTKKIVQQQAPPDIDFRIVRPDGKLRYMRQRGKLVVSGESDMIMIITLQDVTVEMATGQKLADQKQQLFLQQTAMRQAEVTGSLGNWLWDLQTDKITWSDGLFDLLGQRPALVEPSTKQLLRNVHAEDKKRFADELQLIVQEKGERKFEFRLLRNGSIRLCQAILQLVAYSGTESVIGMVQDITLRKQLEHERDVQEQQAASITENSLDRVFITDVENTIRVWNRRSEKEYGLKKETVIGKNIFDVFPHLKNETDLVLFNRVLNGVPVFIPYSKSLVRQEYHDVHMVPLKDEHGTVTGILHLLRDVTKEQEMQLRLSERLNFIESLVDASVDRILVMDRYMNYLYCNQKAADYYGLHKEEIIGKNVLEVFPASVNDLSHEHFRRALKGETVHIPAIEGLSDAHYHEVFLIPIFNDANTVSAVLWMHHDLSGEVNIRRQLQKSDEIINAVNAAFIELDSDFNIRYANKMAEVYFGMSKIQLFGKLIWELYPQLLIASVREAIEKVAAEGIQTGLEFYSNIFKRQVYMSAAPSADGVILFFYDRQEIQEVQEQYRSLVENTPDGISRWDKNLKLIFANSAFQSKTSVPATTQPGKNNEPDLSFMESLQQVFETGAAMEHYNSYPAGNGEMHFFTRMVPEKNAVGEIETVLAIARDITELKKAEQERTESKDLLQAVFRTVRHGIVVMKAMRDEKGEIIDFSYLLSNGVAERHLGSDFTRKTLRTVTPRYVDEEAFRIMVQTVETGQPADHIQHYLLGKSPVWLYSQYNKLGDGLVLTHEDITERKAREEQLKEQANFISQVTHTVPDMISVIELGTNRIEYINRESLMESGFNYDGLTKKSPQQLRELIHPDDKKAVGAYFSSFLTALDTEERVLEYRATNDFGLWQWFRARGRVFRRDDSGVAAHCLNVVQNINVSKTAVDTLKEQAHFIEGIATATPDIIWVMNLETTAIVYTNRQMANVLGYSDEQLSGMQHLFFDLLYEPDIVPMLAHLEAVKKAADGKIVEIECRMKHANGSFLRWFLNRCVVFRRDAAGKAIEKIGIFQDITERKNSEDELFKNFNLLQQAEELGGMGSWEYKITEDKMNWSEGMYQLFDLEQGSHVKKETYLDYTIKDDRSIAKTLIRQLRAGADTMDETLTIETPAGTRKVLKLKGVVVKDAAGKPVRMLGVDLDITELVKAEERLKALNRSLDQRNKELEAKNDELANFSFIASHDLREPLRKIHTFSDWLKQRERGNLSEMGQNYLNRMILSVQRMDRLIEDVLVLTKLQSAAFEREVVDLNNVLNSVKAEFAESIKLTKAGIKSDKLPTITGNKIQLQHLFQNLISNAIKFQTTGSSPKINIKAQTVNEAEIVEQGLNIEHAYAKICFADNGIGFEKHYQQKVFQIFQRLHARTEYEGTGIGLTIAKKVMENHDGAITVESTPGHGSTFCCYFPL